MSVWSYSKLFGRTFIRSFRETLGSDPKMLAYNDLVVTIDDNGIEDGTAIRAFMELATARPERWMLARMLDQFSTARPRAFDLLRKLLQVS